MPFVDLQSQYLALKSDIDARIQRVLDHGQYIMGPEVNELEQALASRVGVAHCVTVSSGTEGLLIALMSLGIKPGDEVITTPFTFAATAEMIVLLGAVPVFVDIQPDTCNIEAANIEAAITTRTRAIMPVSLYGQVADMDEINAIASRHGLAVIEDAAQSFGSTYKRRKSCGLSTWGVTSFFPSKPLGCYGDGGAMFTDDAALARAAREIRVHGQSQRYTHTRIGVGGRMDTLQCAVVLSKLTRFDWEIERRVALGNRYQQQLADLPVQRLTVRSDRDCVWAQFTVLLADATQRGALQAGLSAQGVPTAIHYPRPMHQQPAYEKYAPSWPLPFSEAVSRRVMSLPMSADLTDKQQDRVVSALKVAIG
ncbi:DegT/DnrJ/EryC1/StrS family aminotransferase [Pelomonas aquatica]|uniref:DegT/DnrJ/EryC1/StrS family aminotransferase n=1 Tax=Pelomonas aquatica TaxID=431058 RepID=UPI00286A16F4|nr:DegT/DnrJ/EryC1/StrS family aminotransferase [Pelomonas aquatica]